MSGFPRTARHCANYLISVGGGRPTTFSVCRSAEAVVAGESAGCNLSHRAEAKLREIQERLPFVDGTNVPVVSDGKGTVRVWTFAGGLANALNSFKILLNGIRTS